MLTFVNIALRNIPYFRDRYGNLQLQELSDFERTIEFIDRDVVREHFDALRNPRIKYSHCDVSTTAGTSGKPLRILVPKIRYIVELATMHEIWAEAGYDLNARAVIRNHRLDDGESYRINPITREIIFDGFRLTDDYFELIYETIRKHGVGFIHCYPSVAYEFGRYIQRRALDPSFIRAFLSGSENVFEYQVDLIERQLGIRFFNWYGHSEKIVLGGYCSNTRLYHMEPTYGYFELVDAQGNVVRNVGGWGEIVGTALHNTAMPLLRYRTGDWAENAGNVCPGCGRSVPLIRNIHGRWSGERIFKADGTFVTATALNLHSDLYSVINGLQYVQERRGELRVLVVKGPGYNRGHEEQLYAHYRSCLGPGNSVSVEYVERMRKSGAGKFVLVFSAVDPLVRASC
ncbi:MAG: phenylacetate--CoA ligase family protein [Steroidobacteraceae bacterium]|nr:phenylacetate--CoA ligase family protein [Steroidobacteraceae bacterium]